jgi:hypothetical protein
MPTRCNRCFFADLVACSTCFGDHYVHHQELESIIQLVGACGLWCLVFKLPVWRGAEGCVSDLRAASLMTLLSTGVLCSNLQRTTIPDAV